MGLDRDRDMGLETIVTWLFLKFVVQENSYGTETCIILILTKAIVKLKWDLKAHNHEAIHVHANHILDGSPVSMRHWNVRV